MINLKEKIRANAQKELNNYKYFYEDYSHVLDGETKFVSLFMNLEEIVDFLNSDKYDENFVRVYQTVDVNSLKDGILLKNLKTMAGDKNA